MYFIICQKKINKERGCPGVLVHEGIPFVFITIHGVMTQFVNVSFLCVPVHEDTTQRAAFEFMKLNEELDNSS